MCKITAPEDEPQRGTVIQTDPSGKIETVKDDQGLNRIVSREEFMNRPENQPMQRPDNQSGMLQQYSDKEAAVMDMNQMTANYNAAFGGINPNLNFIAPRRFTPRPKEIDQFDEARMLQAGIQDLAPPPMQPLADMPYTGIEQSLAREAQAGRLRNQSDAYKDFFFEEGLRMSDANPLESGLMNIRDAAQKALGYEEGMRGLFEMDKDKKKSQEQYAENQRQRNKDRDREQKSPFDPCPEGFTYNPVKKMCEPDKEVEGEAEIGTKFTFNQAAPPNFLTYGQTGGEYNFFTEMPGVASPNVRTMANGGKGLDSLPRAPQGETQGKIKEDKEGPFMLSGSEYVLPTEQIIEIGGGDYKKGIKALDKQRYAALRKYKDRVEQLKA